MGLITLWYRSFPTAKARWVAPEPSAADNQAMTQESLISGRLRERRPFVGVVAIACLVVGAGLHFASSDDRGLALSGGLLKVGIVLACLWAAIPVLQRLDWSRATSTAGVAVVAAGLLLTLFGRVSPRLTLPITCFGLGAVYIWRVTEKSPHQRPARPWRQTPRSGPPPADRRD